MPRVPGKAHPPRVSRELSEAEGVSMHNWLFQYHVPAQSYGMQGAAFGRTDPSFRIAMGAQEAAQPGRWLSRGKHVEVR